MMLSQSAFVDSANEVNFARELEASLANCCSRDVSSGMV
jgi:hypothetical protein